MTDNQATQGLLDFVRACPTMFHTAAAIGRRLEEAGFAYLSEGEAWHMEPGTPRASRSRRRPSLPVLATTCALTWRPMVA